MDMIFKLPENYLWRQLIYCRNEPAFVRLYDLHTAQMFHLAMQLTAGNSTRAEDIVQNTWIAAVENPACANRQSLIERLVYCSMKHYEQHSYYMLLHDDCSETMAPGIVLPRNIEAGLGLLSVGYRHVFVLHDIIGYKHSAISSLLQLSERNSKSQLFHARKALRKSIAEKDQYAEWSGAELKMLRAIYADVAAPKELRKRVIDQLYAKALIRDHAADFVQQKLLRMPGFLKKYAAFL